MSATQTRCGVARTSFHLMAAVTAGSILTSCGAGSTPEAEYGAAVERVEESGSLRRLRQDETAPDFPTRPLGESSDAPLLSTLYRARSASAPPPSTRALYRQLGPATVIIRARQSMGTGVVVGPGGLVLTNHHVVASGRRENFQLTVQVEYGRVGESGTMEPDGERRNATVLKVDPDRDLAVLRVENPPESAPIVALAAEDPAPGGTVACMGHGNSGLVWAIRSCQVEATGRMAESLAGVQAACGNEEPEAQTQCEHLRAEFEAKTGLMVQTSCVLAPGDSGGPLVNAEGHLVGLNVMTVGFGMFGGGSRGNFHVHAQEIRDFLQEIPERSEPNLPSPWLTGMTQKMPMDADLDGRFDTVMVMDRTGTSVRLLDLDQDTPDFSLEELGTLVDEQRFDTEVAIISQGTDTYVWYDQDQDGRLELLLQLERGVEIAGAVTVGVDGEIVAADGERERAAFSERRIPAAQRERFNVLVGQGAKIPREPSPLPVALRMGYPADSNADGTPDTLHADQAILHAMTFDVDQDGTPQYGQVEAAVREGRLDVEVSFVRVGELLFVFYDRDNDGVFDAAVKADSSSGVVREALAIEGQAGLQTDDVLGTSAVRGDWLSADQNNFKSMVSRHVPTTWVTMDTSGLPHPIDQHESPVIQESSEERAWRDAVVTLQSRDLMTTAVDVDKSSFRGRGRRHRSSGIENAVREGNFSADFALMTGSGVAWAWYDTNLDGTFDVVLVKVGSGEASARNAFRRNGDGSFGRDAELVDGPLVRPSLFPRRQRRAFKQLAERLLDGDEVED